MCSCIVDRKCVLDFLEGMTTTSDNTVVEFSGTVHVVETYQKNTTRLLNINKILTQIEKFQQTIQSPHIGDQCSALSKLLVL